METRLVRVQGKNLCLDCLYKSDPKVSLAQTASFLFETGMLKKTPRSGYQFLWNGAESVALVTGYFDQVAGSPAKDIRVDGGNDARRT